MEEHINKKIHSLPLSAIQSHSPEKISTPCLINVLPHIIL